MEEECDYYFKIILLGCQAVGKTAIVQRFCYDCYEEESLKTTLGFDFLTKVLLHKGKKVQLQIWDTAGQERFRSVTKMYYQDVNGVILVYDITSKETINKLQFWLDDLEMNGGKTERRILVGNKIDLAKSREVQPFDGKRLASEQNMDWAECSAKSGVGISELFEKLIEKLIQEQLEKKMKMNGAAQSSTAKTKSKDKGKVKKKLSNSTSKESKGCC